MKSFSFGKESLRNRHGVDQRLIEIDDLALKLSLVDFGHGPDSGVRTAERQNQLFMAGASKADGFMRRSNHQAGRALDFYAYVGGKVSYQRAHLAMVACAYFQAASILGHKIGWGGLWTSKAPAVENGIPYGWDCPHIELLD